jgi:hypothetical protein
MSLNLIHTQYDGILILMSLLNLFLSLAGGVSGTVHYDVANAGAKLSRI